MSNNEDQDPSLPHQQQHQQEHFAQAFAAQAMFEQQQHQGAAAAAVMLAQQQQQQQAAQQQSHQNPLLQQFWANQIQQIEEGQFDFKSHQLPLARIKKVMKTDEDVRSKMISAEVPILFAKACEIFVLELTMRSWFHTEQNKRRTLQKSDISAAISKTDMFDFLIDIVPRDTKKLEDLRHYMAPEIQQYYHNLVASQYPNAGVADANMLAYQQQLQMQQYRMSMGGDPSAGLPQQQDEQQEDEE